MSIDRRSFLELTGLAGLARISCGFHFGPVHGLERHVGKLHREVSGRRAISVISTLLPPKRRGDSVVVRAGYRPSLKNSR